MAGISGASSVIKGGSTFVLYSNLYKLITIFLSIFQIGRGIMAPFGPNEAPPLMAGQIGSVVMGEVVNKATSFIANKIDKLIDVSDKVERLEWKVLKIQSAIEESMKYDIKNEALNKMQQKLMDAAQEGEKVLQQFKNHVAVPNSQSLDQAVTSLNSIVQSSNSDEIQQPINFHLVLNSLLHKISIIRPISQSMKNMLIKMKERENLHRILARIEVISEDIGDFLQMLTKHQKKMDKRWRYRPYLAFYKLLCVELARDALDYWGAQVSWKRIPVPETTTSLIETKEEFGLKAGYTSIYELPKMLFNVLN
jgi:Rx N-terminal domain